MAKANKADKLKDLAEAESVVDSDGKRRVKNPETFRERAIKASEASDKPARSARVRSATSKVTSPVLSPIGRVLRRIGKFPPMRILGKILVPPYIRNSWKELRLVEWPNAKLARQLTGAVLGFAIVFGVSIAVVDYGLDKLFKHILLK